MAGDITITAEGQTMSESNALVELRENQKAKWQLMGDVIKAAGTDMDMSRQTVLTMLSAVDSADAVSKFQQLDREVQGLSADLRTAELKESKKRYENLTAEMERPANQGAGFHASNELKHRSFGDLIVQSKEYASKAANRFRDGGSAHTIEIDIKTLFERTAGFAPESPRTGLMVPAVAPPVVILDLIPTRPMNQAVDKYMEETTRTHGAAEKAEGTAYAESTFVWTERTSPVEKITDSLPVTDEQLQDAPEVASLLNGRLTYGLRKRLELQVVVGDGVAPNLRGFLDPGFGIQTQAKGADPTFDAIFKALTLVRHTGDAIPSGIIMHPNDYQDVRLTRTASGEYIMGPPMAPGSTTLFGLPIAISTVITENTALVGDFVNFCYIGENKGVDVQVGYVGDQFKEGKKTIRADLRVCFTVTRKAAFASVTGI
jgi:HK97 family phage major capsid protein